MNFLKTSAMTGLLTSLIFISGCSDFFQKDVVDKSLESNKFKANCELNVDEFALILEEPIGEAIDCLGKNLKLFMKSVESKKPGYLSRFALISYIKKNRQDIKPEVLKTLQSVFDLNFLVYGEDRDFISEANVDALVDVAKVFNEKASTNFKPIFMDNNSLDYDNYRVQRDQRVKPAAVIVSSALGKIFRPDRKGRIDTINLSELIDAFTTENNQASMANVKKMLFAKKIILGGDKNIMTHIEFGHLVENFSSYVLLALDGIRYKDIRLDQESTINFLNSDLELLNSLIFNSNMPNRNGEVLFSLQDALDAVEIFLGHDSNLHLSKYTDLIKEAKLVLMDGEPEIVTGADLRRLFSHGLTLLKTGTYFHRFWATERILLDARPGRPITYDFKNLYDLFKSEKLRVDDFVRILKKYRFLRGENISAFYTDVYMRNPDGVFEVAVYEYGLTLLMKKFGCPNNTLGGTVVCDGKPVLNGVYMKTEHVVNLVQKLKKVLIEAQMILPGREVKTAETISLLGQLFQYQSDENKVFDVNEATEFGISLFTSMDVANDINDHFIDLSKKNECEMDKFGRVSPVCFRKHFFEGVCLNYPDQFPKLFSSLGATVYETDPNRPNIKKLVCRIPSDAPNLAYLDRSVKAARSCNVYPNTDEEIFFNKGDTMSVFLAMMHIETTILRWDTRQHNNVMDPAEVMDAYSIYSPALDGFLEKMPNIIKKLKKQIFQYMVKYEKVPDEKDFSSLWKFAKFLLSFNKDAPANRKTIASILVTIGEQGTPSAFDCSLLRDPDHIPEDYDPSRMAVTSSAVRPTSMSLTRSDNALAQDIETSPDSVIKGFLSDNWPTVFH